MFYILQLLSATILNYNVVVDNVNDITICCYSLYNVIIHLSSKNNVLLIEQKIIHLVYLLSHYFDH